MTFDVYLVKKMTSFEKDGVKKRGTNFYLQVGDEYIPIEVVFFPNEKCEGRDPAYASRNAILSAVARELPPKSPDESSTSKAPD